MAQNAPATTATPPRTRWRGPILILALWAVAMLVILIEPDLLRGMHSVLMLAVSMAAGIALLVWFFVFSRISGRSRLLGAGLLLLSFAALARSIRSDGWDGSMRPILAWRWTPTAEERFQASRNHAPAVTREASAQLSEPTQGSSHDYPGFLGADRRGVVADLQLNLDWKTHPPRELWRKPVGLGWSAFAVVGDVAVTQEQRGEQESVVCYELKTGVERWAHVDLARFSEALGGDGPRATPTIHEGRIYALGATGILNCLDLATGQRQWSRNILTDSGAGNRDWGMTGSPLIVDNHVIVCPGGDGGHSIWAYHLETGEPAWHTGDDAASYTSGLLATLAGVPQVLVLTATALVSLDPADGRQLWRYEWRPDQVIKCAQPVPLADYGYTAGTDQVFLSSGYTVGSQLLQVSLKEGQWSLDPLWSTRQLRSKFSNVLVHGGFVYGLDEGILTCLDLRDGSRQWKQGRYGYGQMILVGDVLLVQAESGEVVLVQAAPQGHRELARLPALADKTWNNPVLAGPYLLVRNDREAACYELR